MNSIESFLTRIHENGIEKYDLAVLRQQLSLAAGYASYASEMVGKLQEIVDRASIQIVEDMVNNGEYKKYNIDDREKIIGDRIGNDYYKLKIWERRLKSLDNLCIRMSTISKSILDEWERSNRPTPT